MPYLFDLENDFDQEPFVDADGSHIIDFALGYDVDHSLIVLMSVMLIADPSGAFELCFGIRRRSASNVQDISPPDYSSATARRYVPRSAATDVLELIVIAIIALVRKAKPEHVIMETFHANLPPKAMKKYEVIVSVLEWQSYRLVEQFRNEEDGKDYWSFTRAD
jgi:hypothetical protein